MTIDEIKIKTLDVYRLCSIKSFPVSTVEILKKLEIPYFSYSKLREKSEELYQMGVKFSKDAFTWNRLVCYNDAMPLPRIHFSLMHELGHIFLHSSKETEANYFASHILAPRIVLHQTDFQDTQQLSQLFGISKQAAEVVSSDYNKYYKGKSLSQLSPADQELYRYFYDKKLDFFVYHISECPECGATIYNSLKKTCWRCSLSSSKEKKQDASFYHLEQNWLYPEN